MKKIIILISALFFLNTVSKAQSLKAQLLYEKTKERLSIGADLFTDLSTGKAYDNFKLRTINQGIDVYAIYNFPIAKSKHTVSLGVGFTAHNFFLKGYRLDEPYNDITAFTNVNNCKRSKINVNYIDIPLEVNFRIKNMFKISLGFKYSILTTGKSKYVGKIDDTGKTYRIKYSRINNLEKYVYSGTLRVAYKEYNIFIAYQFSNTFTDGSGPNIMPLSIGIGVKPF